MNKKNEATDNVIVGNPRCDNFLLRCFKILNILVYIQDDFLIGQ